MKQLELILRGIGAFGYNNIFIINEYCYGRIRKTVF